MNIQTELHDLHNLVPNFGHKEKYVIHHENLKLYENLGLKITKIHRGIRFDDRPWLKSYIELNTSLQAKATNSFEKDVFKLMNNSIFGKQKQN